MSRLIRIHRTCYTNINAEVKTARTDDGEAASIYIEDHKRAGYSRLANRLKRSSSRQDSNRRKTYRRNPAAADGKLPRKLVPPHRIV